MPDQQQVGDTVVIIVVLGALAIGLLSVLIGYVVSAWDRFRAWWMRGIEAAEQRSSVKHYQEDAGDDQSGSAPDRPGSDAGSQRVVPPRITETHQIEPKEPSICEPPDDPIIISHKMSKKELTILLAVQKDDEGAYRFSANRIAEFVGGTSAETKGWVAEVRGKKESTPNTMRRPAGGWGRAS